MAADTALRYLEIFTSRALTDKPDPLAVDAQAMLGEYFRERLGPDFIVTPYGLCISVR